MQNEVPEPVLFNCWKHHAAALRDYIVEYAARGETGLDELAAQVAVIGHELMDLYVGVLSPTEIAEEVLEHLRSAKRLDEEVYCQWLQENGGYTVVEFATDGTRWVLRQGEQGGRFIHVHPARWAPLTRRVRANVLKSAVVVNAYVLVHGGDPLRIKLVNRVRQQYLGLSPMARLNGDQGMQPIIELVRPSG